MGRLLRRKHNNVETFRRFNSKRETHGILNKPNLVWTRRKWVGTNRLHEIIRCKFLQVFRIMRAI